MKQMKHTPGPWETVTGSAIHSKEGHWVATIRGETPEIRIANNRLISAAPELLMALKNLIEFTKDELKEIGGCDHSVGICCCGIYSWLDQAEEAVKKAEGLK